MLACQNMKAINVVPATPDSVQPDQPDRVGCPDVASTASSMYVVPVASSTPPTPTTQTTQPVRAKLCSNADHAYFDVDQFGNIIGWFDHHPDYPDPGQRKVLLRLHLDSCRVTVNQQHTVMCVHDDQVAYVFMLSDLLASLSSFNNNNNQLVYQQVNIDDYIAGSKACELAQPSFLVFSKASRPGNMVVYDVRQNKKAAEFPNTCDKQFHYHADSQTLCFHLAYNWQRGLHEIWALRAGLLRLYFIGNMYDSFLHVVPSGFEVRKHGRVLLSLDTDSMFDTCQAWRGSVRDLHAWQHMST